MKRTPLEWAALALIIVTSTTVLGEDKVVFTRSEPFALHMTEVRSLPTKGVGLSKGGCCTE